LNIEKNTLINTR